MKISHSAALLFVIGTAGPASSAQVPTPSAAATERSLRIAVVQMASLDHDIDANLKRATAFAEQAVNQGAQFVLFPEFMATGSYLSFDTWESAEPSNGRSVQWLKSNSRRLHVWLATSFLEASGPSVEETLRTALFRSRCPVTAQPDYGDVMIRYRGPRIDRVGLLRYLVSYRTHAAFHEACVESIFVDILRRCASSALTVYARFLRRGGIDINPFRSNFEDPPPDSIRTSRQ